MFPSLFSYLALSSLLIGMVETVKQFYLYHLVFMVQNVLLKIIGVVLEENAIVQNHLM
jgi:hypothetical protein